uniref:Uncharacterized protein n=1 Tax=Cannabis sativa TaxID=3483 RepID=A0A803QRW6_CANSA
SMSIWSPGSSPSDSGSRSNLILIFSQVLGQVSQLPILGHEMQVVSLYGLGIGSGRVSVGSLSRESWVPRFKLGSGGTRVPDLVLFPGSHFKWTPRSRHRPHWLSQVPFRVWVRIETWRLVLCLRPWLRVLNAFPSLGTILELGVGSDEGLGLDQ